MSLQRGTLLSIPQCPTPQGTLGTMGCLPPAGSRMQGEHNWWRSFFIPLSEGTYKDKYHLSRIIRDIIIIIILIRPSTDHLLPYVRLFQVRSLSFIFKNFFRFLGAQLEHFFHRNIIH